MARSLQDDKPKTRTMPRLNGDAHRAADSVSTAELLLRRRWRRWDEARPALTSAQTPLPPDAPPGGGARPRQRPAGWGTARGALRAAAPRRARGRRRS